MDTVHRRITARRPRVRAAGNYPDQLAGALSLARIERDARALYETDKTYCYRDMLKTADHAAALLREAGARVRVTPLQADGVTTNLDYTMPQAWDVDDGRLEVVSPANCACPVLADYAVDRFVIPNRCMATPPGGITAGLVDYDDRDRKDVRGQWVLVKAAAHGAKADLIARGAAGIVAVFSGDGKAMPDAVTWHNGWSQGVGWYHCKEEPRIVMFSISARRGRILETLLAEGRDVVLKGFVKSRTYDGVIKTVRGLIPGKRPEEIVVLGHMYEPLPDDNAVGNAAMIEIGRVIRQRVEQGTVPRPYYSIRILLGMERYGLGQFFASAARSRKVLAVINVDAISMNPRVSGVPDTLTSSPLALPFFGDIVLDELVVKHSTSPFQRERGRFGDDTFMADPRIGVPAAWYWNCEGPYHHSSANTFDQVDWATCLEKTGIILRYVASLAWLDPAAARGLLPRVVRGANAGLDRMLEELRQRAQEYNHEVLTRNIRFLADVAQGQRASLARFGVKAAALRQARVAIERHVRNRMAIFTGVRVAPIPADRVPGPEERRARNTIPWRLTRGLPFDLAKAPFAERKRYAWDMERFVAWMDGRRDLWEVIQCFAMDRGVPVLPEEAGRLIQYARYLSRYGYLRLVPGTTVDKAAIKRGLRRLGIRQGDRIMVHASLTSLGQVRGGARAVIAALMETVTKDGVLMMPSFNHGVPFQKGPGYYAPKETPTSNGIIADTFWRMPGVKRSLDPAHPVAAWGRNALEYVKRHGEVPTMGVGSPIHLLQEAGGKVVLLGTGYGPNSLRHVVEMTHGAKCLGVRTEEYPVKLPNGRRIKGRTWSWRAGFCPLMDDVHWAEERMVARKLDRRATIGNELVISFRMRDFQMVAGELLRKGLPGIPCCRDCGIGVACTGVKEARVPSDWTA